MKAKKIFKGMTAAAVAAVLAASMVPMTAFADGVNGYNVTVNTSQTGVKARVRFYKVADVSSVGNNAWEYDYTSDFGGASSTFPDLNTVAGYATDSTEAKEYAANLAKYVTDNGKVASYSGDTGDSITVEAGYYLVLSTVTNNAGKVVSPSLVLVTNADQKVNVKTGDLTFTKKITEITNGTKGTGNALTKTDNTTGTDTAEGELNSIVTYSLTAQIPSYSDEVKNAVKADPALDITDMTITDTPSLGLTYQGDNTVIVTNTTDKTTLTKDTDYKLESVAATDTTSAGFKVVFFDSYVVDNMNDTVVVSFQAKVNENAIIGTNGNDNTAIYNFGNDYSTGKGNGEIKDYAKVYTTELKVNKTFVGDDADTAEAGFSIYKKGTYNASNPELNRIGSEQKVKNNGTISFERLSAGEYEIVETTVPNGYKDAGIKNVTITANGTVDYDGTYTFADATTDGIVRIENTKGSTLPGTGGMGTIIFTVAGAGVVLVAGIMLIVYMKKRKIEE